MKITDVKVNVFTHKTRPFRFRDGFPAYKGQLDVLAVRICTDEGVEGHSLSLACQGGGSGRILAEMLRTVIKPVVVGEDPLQRERIWQKIWDYDTLAFLPIYAQGPIDVALWDLGGRVAGMPIYQMLGGYRDKVLAYASTLTLPTVEDYGPHALELKAHGFKAIKLHVWGNPKKDIAAYREVRKAVGDDYVLMFDAACAYNHEEALWVGKQLEEIGCYFYESPLRDYDVTGMRDLADQLTVPTAVAEMVSGSYFTCAQFVAFKAGDILRGDVTIKGGISPLVKLAHLCEAFGMMCEVHTGGNTYADMANLHVICAIKNCAYCEMIVPSDLRHFGLKDGPLDIDKDGYVHVSKKPGVGLELDWDKIEAETIY